MNNQGAQREHEQGLLRERITAAKQRRAKSEQPPSFSADEAAAITRVDVKIAEEQAKSRSRQSGRSEVGNSASFATGLLNK